MRTPVPHWVDGLYGLKPEQIAPRWKLYLIMVFLLNPVWLNRQAHRLMLRQVIHYSLCESPRVCRRLHFLRGWSYEQTGEIFPVVP
jgi:hypothetical protein